jgi:hypothetical protein
MKIVLNESQFNSAFTKFLDKSGIDMNIGWNGSGRQNVYGERIITGFVTINENGKPISFQFTYKYEDNELSLYGIYPDVGIFGFGEVFKGFPNELLIEYFSGMIKDYIYMKLESK